MSVDIVPLQHIQVLTHTALVGVQGAPTGRDPLSWYSLPYSQLAGLAWHELSDFERRATPERADVIGQMLMDENVVSFGHLYPDVEIAHYPLWCRLPYAHQPLNWKLTPVECLKAIEGYVYQAGEHAGWYDSEAAQFCEALRLHAIQALSGWREAPFLFDHILVNHRSASRPPATASPASPAQTKG